MQLSPRSAARLAELAKTLDIPAVIEFIARYGHASEHGAIGEHLRRIRRGARALSVMSMQEVCDRSGINLKTLSAYETGRHRVPLEVLGDLLECYGMSYREFFDGVGIVDWHPHTLAQQETPGYLDEARVFPLEIPPAQLPLSKTEMRAMSGTRRS